MPGNLNTLSEQLSLGCFSKSTRVEEINDFAMEEGFLKKWFSLKNSQLNQLWAFFRMCVFHWLFYWKADQCHRQGCHGAVTPETCLSQPQPQPGAPRSPGCTSESYKVSLFLELGLSGMQWCRGTAILGSLILEGLPHILPEGERNKQLCMSRSLGVHGKTKEKRQDIWPENFPGNKIQNSYYVLPAPWQAI